MMQSPTISLLEVENIFNISIEQNKTRRKSSVKEPVMSYTNKAITCFMDAIGKMNEGVLVPSKLRDIEVRPSEATSLMPANADLFSFYQMLNNVKHDLFSTSKFHTSFHRRSNGSGQNSGRTSPSPGHMNRRPSSTMGMYGIPNNGSVSPTPKLQAPTTLALDRRASTGAFLDTPSPDTPTNSYLAAQNNNFLSPTSPVSPIGAMLRAPSLNTLLQSNDYEDLSCSPISGGDVSTEEQVEHVTACFSHHLTALYTILGHFTRSAEYILERYQQETENSF